MIEQQNSNSLNAEKIVNLNETNLNIDTKEPISFAKLFRNSRFVQLGEFCY
jgi:hypothetical protein